jgi:hypothetical protein
MRLIALDVRPQKKLVDPRRPQPSSPGVFDVD